MRVRTWAWAVAACAMVAVGCRGDEEAAAPEAGAPAEGEGAPIEAGADAVAPRPDAVEVEDAGAATGERPAAPDVAAAEPECPPPRRFTVDVEALEEAFAEHTGGERGADDGGADGDATPGGDGAARDVGAALEALGLSELAGRGGAAAPSPERRCHGAIARARLTLGRAEDVLVHVVCEDEGDGDAATGTTEQRVKVLRPRGGGDDRYCLLGTVAGTWSRTGAACLDGDADPAELAVSTVSLASGARQTLRQDVKGGPCAERLAPDGVAEASFWGVEDGRLVRYGAFEVTAEGRPTPRGVAGEVMLAPEGGGLTHRREVVCPDAASGCVPKRSEARYRFRGGALIAEGTTASEARAAAQALYREGDFARAADAYLAALALAPDDASARAELGRALGHAGWFSAARRHLSAAAEAAQRDDERASWSFEIGRVAEAMGDRAGALRAYRAALEARPGHAAAERRVVALERLVE